MSVWAFILAERFGQHRPLRSVCRALRQHGLPIAPGTLADAQRRLLPLFEQLDEESSRHLWEAPVVNGDETGWRIRELGEKDGGSARAWVWIARSHDATRTVILPSRSAEAARELFGGLGSPEQAAYLVCDRYSAYRKLARDMDGDIVLSWAHARRDFVNLETGYPNLAPFARKWVGHIAKLYRFNSERLANDATAQRRLARFAEAFFAAAKKARDALPESAAQRGPLDSLVRHRDGLTVFVDNASVPMDNNAAERGIAVGRKLSFGSHSVDGARLAGMLYSIFGTLEMNGVSPYPWLFACCLRPARRPAAGRSGRLAAVGRGRRAPPFLEDRSPPGTVNVGPRRYCGRDFSEDELGAIRALIERGGLTRRALSREVCRLLDWRKPDGGLKDMSARVAMLRMHGLIVLPPPRQAPSVRRPPVPGPATDQPLVPTPERLADVQPVVVDPCRNANEGRLWNEFVARYHYLGHSTLPGAQMRYFVRAADGEALAVLGFGAAAWKIAPRDKCVGWDPEARRRNLPLVVNNARFLILPWVRIKNLASHVLTLVERRLPDDWESRYALRPVLLETFCETPRFAGTCYRATNWIKVGATQGRGKLDTRRECALPVKDIWLKPLRRDWRRILKK